MAPRLIGRTIGLAAMVLAGACLGASAQAQAPDPSGTPSGEQVLTQGPIHEAFAAPVVYDPKPGPVIPKPPPAPIQEVPPDQKPEGADVQWIPGYWAWDDGRQDYLWVSGVWRDVPPGRQWVPGYWNQAQGGVQWIPGAWMPLEADPQANPSQYLPEPPASLEAGPNSPPPSEDAIWAPGNWLWQDGQYAWQPGYWVNSNPGWVWNPSQYTYTPTGYLYSNGYWDRPLDQRGQLFAPVYLNQSVYSQPNFTYRPTIGLMASGLLSSLFVRPSYGQYYFGDYYGQNNFNSGIYPWYSFHQSRFGYDPLYSYYASSNRQSNPNWGNQLRENYAYRRDHADARPARTYAEMSRLGGSNITNNFASNNASNLSFARPIAQIASIPNGPVRFQRIDAQQQARLADQSRQLRQYQGDRVRREAESGKSIAGGTAAQPRHVELPRSPILAARNPAQAPAGSNVPANHLPPRPPSQPQVDRNPARPAAERPQPRPEPHPDVQHDARGFPRPVPGAQPGRPFTYPGHPVAEAHQPPQARPEAARPAAQPPVREPARPMAPRAEPRPTPRPEPPKAAPAPRPEPPKGEQRKPR